MGFVVQAESHTCEYPFLLRCELDPECVGFYCQPEAIQVRRTLPNGKPHISAHRFDYLVVRRRQIEVVECRTRDSLDESVRERPHHWFKDGNGFRCIPYEDAVKPLGLVHRIFCSDEVNAIECANMSILKDALRNIPPADAERIFPKASKHLRHGVPHTIQSLAIALGVESPAVLLRLIAEHRLFASLTTHFLANVETTPIFGTQNEVDEYVAAIEVATTLERAIASLNTSTNTDVSGAPDGNTVDIRNLSIAYISSAQLQESVKRLRQLEPVLHHERAATRNERRWIQQLRVGSSGGLSSAEAVASRTHLRGNADARLKGGEIECAKEHIKKFWLTHIQPSRRATWLAVTWPKDANGKDLSMSYVRFCELCNAVKAEERERSRGGHRAAQKYLPASHPADRSALPTRGWEWAQVDSTVADMKVLVDLGLAQIFLRLTLSILIDVFSKAVLAFWLCFGSPSRNTLSMLYRDCSRRHGRLPNGLLADHGSEHDSTFHETFLAAMMMDKAERPTELPRYASEVETCFEVARQKVLRQLAGNMQNDKCGRSASASHKAHATTRFVIASLYKEMDDYFFSSYNNAPHGKDLFTPNQKLQESVLSVGDLATRAPYDLNFLIQSAIPTKKNNYNIDPRRGIRVADSSYWNATFADEMMRRQKADVVRREPFDPSIVYAHCNRQWYVCCDSAYQRTRGLSEYERWAEAALAFDGKSAARRIKLAEDQKLAKHQLELWQSQQETQPAQVAPPEDRPANSDNSARNEPDFASLRKSPITPLWRPAP